MFGVFGYILWFFNFLNIYGEKSLFMIQFYLLSIIFIYLFLFPPPTLGSYTAFPRTRKYFSYQIKAPSKTGLKPSVWVWDYGVQLPSHLGLLLHLNSFILTNKRIYLQHDSFGNLPDPSLFELLYVSNFLS